MTELPACFEECPEADVRLGQGKKMLRWVYRHLARAVQGLLGVQGSSLRLKQSAQERKQREKNCRSGLRLAEAAALC